ncbi:hypothetical protein [Thalassotalea agarivorans]|uniref:Uncharacterized protein n=1 Tax=Thalassotalea agarivorans TaxID=349064 RepID=A0A1I0H9B0_THASX|nr:hypothetical protein [Thalassotalea agarivorans]SET80255.1 hypothetical protein SAMN05660429_02719 [Thalassotalea agarivorans]
MSHDKDFKDASSKRHLAGAIIALVVAPLLPMLMGWYTFLS